MAHAERGMSAPPEVVFNTAIDPDRLSAWLPAPLRRDGVPGPELAITDLRARWRSAAPPEWSARLQVSPVDAGGATVRIELEADPESVGDPPDRRLRQLADESLVSLAREVADNLNPG